MTENFLETIRHQMRASEERLKRADETGGRNQSLPFERKSSSADARRENSAEEWIAYGQMTPGFLTAIAAFLKESIQNTSEKVRIAPTPELARQLQGMERIRKLLARWINLAESLDASSPDRTFAEMIRDALNARSPELRRWGIRSDFEDATADLKNLSCTPAVYQAILHVLQYCIELLRGRSAESWLFVSLRNSGERLDATFLCEFPSRPVPADPAETGSGSYELLRFTNIALRAAQKILESAGGTLVLENISEIKRAIRIGISISALSAAGSFKETSRI
jgi:hypothetical protein